MNDYKKGMACGLGAYVLWGVLPVYWKLLDDVLPFEILSSRFMWSCVFVALLIIFQGKLPLPNLKTFSAVSKPVQPWCPQLLSSALTGARSSGR